MMENHIGLQVLADALSILQLPLAQVVDQSMHFIGILIVSHQSFADAHQVVALLEQAGSDKDCLVSLGAVNSIHHALADCPLLISEGVLGTLVLDVGLPVLDVLNDDLVGSVDGETAGNVLREGVGNTPGDLSIGLTLTGHLGSKDGCGAEAQLNGFVLVYQTVRIAATDYFAKVFFCG